MRLPNDKETQKWFEENIGIKNDCSASSAIYKFRLWLRELNSGKSAETYDDKVYDDENPDYIRQSAEEI